MSLPVWIIGFSFIAAIGITEASWYSRGRRIVEYENEICEPRKRLLDVDGCSECICRNNGYGSVCEATQCRHILRRPIEDRECTPYGEFTTRCHFCKCSASGTPIGCVEKRRNCMDDILEELDDQKSNGEPDIVDSLDEYTLV